jgi:REP element-mobilizing transposase RayT
LEFAAEVPGTLVDPRCGMSRPLRILAAGALYHVVARGNAKMTIYDDDVDRRRFLTILETVVERYRIECHAYCLMSNHYHAVIRTLEPNLSSAMQYLNSVYAQWWNRRHGRVGHVLQGRFKAQLIQREGYLLEACRYVVLNPVRAGLVKKVEDWAWSSYAATAGLSARRKLLTTSLILGTRSAKACRAYQAFIAAGVSESEVTRALRSDVPIVGSESFAAAHRDVIEQAHPTEVVRRDRTIGRPTLEALFTEVRDKPTRDLRIREARDRFSYRVSEIAKHVSLHYASVSRIATAGQVALGGGPSDRTAEKRPRPGSRRPPCG